jgi:hypothetical protein
MGAVMSVPVTMASNVTFGKPNKVLEGSYFFGPGGRTYDATEDGQRFLMVKENAAAGDPARPAGFVVVLNWLEELKQRVPTR